MYIICTCRLLLGNQNFEDPYLEASIGGRGDHEVARVGRTATAYT